MEERFSRTALLLGRENVKSLSDRKVAIFGIGGVGGYVVEALARTGIGRFELIDSDKISISNINRQIIATQNTIGRYKTEVMKERVLSIHPTAVVDVRNCFFLPENASEFDFSEYDYVVDAVDTVAAKISIIVKAKEAGVPVISAMGAGNKLDPTRFEVADIYQTEMCPLAKVMRHELKKRGIKDCKTVYSKEPPLAPEKSVAMSTNVSTNVSANVSADVSTNVSANVSADVIEAGELEAVGRKRSVPGSVAFVPSVAGLIIAGEVVKDLISDQGVLNIAKK